MQITTIGLDIAKNVFQVHGIDAAEKVIVRKQLRRGKIIAFFEALAPCLVGMEPVPRREIGGKNGSACKFSRTPPESASRTHRTSNRHCRRWWR